MASYIGRRKFLGRGRLAGCGAGAAAGDAGLDTLFRLNDDCAAAELGRHYGPWGLAAEPWPRTI